MLEVTEKCNLNCIYCFFSKGDGFDKRRHSQYSMSEFIAYKAIDYYFNKYINAIKKVPSENRYKVVEQNYPMLQWWGGEPFLAFDLIVKTKSYFESLDWEAHGISKKDIVYGLTSNLTILNDDILNFIVQNNVKLRVSLDGDEESNDKNRVFPDGTGSFSTTMKNLNIIIAKYPDYAKNSVGIQSVLSDNIDVFSAQRFIEKYFNLNTPSHKLITCSFNSQRKNNVFLSDWDFLKESVEDIVFQFRNTLRKIADKPFDEIKKLLRYNKNLYIELKKIILIKDLLVLDYPKGNRCISGMFSCPLAAETIFVSANGNFHCCAKSDYSIPFGHIKTGINITRLKNIYSSYHAEIERHCKSCWAIRFCKICPALVCWNGTFKLPNEQECNNIRKIVEVNLIKHFILSTEFEILYRQVSEIQQIKTF